MVDDIPILTKVGLKHLQIVGKEKLTQNVDYFKQKLMFPTAFDLWKQNNLQLISNFKQNCN